MYVTFDRHLERDACWLRWLFAKHGLAPGAGACNPYSSFELDAEPLEPAQPRSQLHAAVESELVRRLLRVTRPDMPVSMLVPSIETLLQPSAKTGEGRPEAFSLEAYLDSAARQLQDTSLRGQPPTTLSFSPTLGGCWKPATSGRAERRRKRAGSGEADIGNDELARFRQPRQSQPAMPCADCFLLLLQTR